jgi:class 3 adenylate cyclase/DNA-binding SARP family transcriptional activator
MTLVGDSICDYAILGPLEVKVGGRLVPLSGSKQRALLAILVLNVDRVVSTDQLIDHLWGDQPPATAVNALQVYVSQLRRTLSGGTAAGSGVIVTQRPGYRLRLGDGTVDAVRFEDLVAGGREALIRGEAAVASVKLHEALALWRGTALADFALDTFAQRDIDRLEEMRLGALEDRFESDLELGRGPELVPELEATIAQHPLRERLREHLMLALYRSGRQADAIATYQETLTLLRDELGIDPGPGLQRLNEMILKQDSSLNPPQPQPEPSHRESPGLDPVIGDAVSASEQPSPAGVPGTPIAAGEDQLLPVTALFADIVGSTSLGERLMPEEVRVVIGECVTRMSREVERFGGTIQAYMGDGICAYFGIPAAHEDDPERAAWAGYRILLDIREQRREIEQAWGISDFDVRIGINAGRTLVGAVGAANPQVVAFGDPMNVAARLQAIADPGSIAVGESVARRLEGVFHLEPLGAVPLKGREAPVNAWSLIGPRTEHLAAPSTPLVARHSELDRLREAVQEVTRGRGQIVLIRGDVGIGKSRAVLELREMAGDDIRWLEGRCSSYGVGPLGGPFSQIIREWTGAAEGEPELATRTKLWSRLAKLDEGSAEECFHLARILGIRPEPSLVPATSEHPGESLRTRSTTVLAKWVLRLCEEKPTVLVVEDLHQADENSLEQLEALLPLTDRVPLLLVVSSRPEPDSPGWGLWIRCLREFRHRLVELALEPLSDEHVEELMDALAPPGTLDAATRGVILARAAGNPFYVEELVKALVQIGGLERQGRSTLTMTGAGLDLPPALEGLLIVRIQQLEPSARRLAQIAAVIGREFDVDLLRETADRDITEDLTSLLRAEVIREVRRHPAFVCRFHHTLLYEAALSTLTPAFRAEVARSVLRSLESRIAGSEDEHLERLALYAYRSDELPRALDYLERASRRASQLGDDEAAARLAARMLRLADRLGDRAAQSRAQQAAAEVRRLSKPSNNA